MVITDSIQDTCQHTDYKSRTFWMVFSTSSRQVSASAICCLSSLVVPGIFSMLLWMALPSLTLASNSYFFCLMASGIWARVDLWWPMAAFMFSSSFSSSTCLISRWDNSGSGLRDEFFKLSFSCVSSLASTYWNSPWPARFHDWTSSSGSFLPSGPDLQR